MTMNNSPQAEGAPTPPALPSRFPGGDSLSARTLAIASHGWEAFLARCETPEERGAATNQDGEAER